MVHPFVDDAAVLGLGLGRRSCNQSESRTREQNHPQLHA